MANGDGDGFLWILAIGTCVWAWSNHEKLKDEREARAISHQRMQSQVDDLASRINEMQRKVDFAESDIKSAFAAQDRIRTVVNKNADIENRKAVREMTARGACGTETIQYPNGGFSVRNKECTLKDLRQP